jgi:hypothetical protein
VAHHNALLLAWSSPVDDSSAEEFHRWYEEVHVPEVRAAVPGIVDVRRYALTDVSGGDPVNRFLAVYEIKTDDLAGAAAALGAASAGGQLTPTQSMDYAGAPPVLEWYTSR